MKAFHGTSLKNALAIVNGSTDKNTGIWSVSDNDGAFYFYPVNKIADEYGLDIEYDFDDVIYQGINKAKWHGQAATCHAPTDETTFVVLEMSIPDDLIEDDFSCPNMDSIASFINIDDLGKVTFDFLHVGSMSVYHRPYVLSNVVWNDECFTDSEIDPDLLAMANLLASAGGDGSDIYEAINDAETEGMSLETFIAQYGV